jgi:hypothetical protein
VEIEEDEVRGVTVDAIQELVRVREAADVGVPGSREHAFQQFDVGSAVVDHQDPSVRTRGFGSIG